MIRLASETPPVEVAWLAFDEAMLEMQRMYREGSYLAQRRRAQALKVARLWRDFIALSDDDSGEPRSVA